MKKSNDDLLQYLIVLRTIQPARIQDIERSASKIFSSWAEEEGSGSLRMAHIRARELGLVIRVRKGSYFLSEAGRRIVSNYGINNELDNRRLFLMKEERKSVNIFRRGGG